jgi:hypothetical protein
LLIRLVPSYLVGPRCVEPGSGHAIMHLADGHNVQESTWGQVSPVKRKYSSAFWTGLIDVGKV